MCVLIVDCPIYFSSRLIKKSVVNTNAILKCLIFLSDPLILSSPVASLCMHAFVRSPHAILHMNEMCASNVKQNRKAARGIVPADRTAGDYTSRSGVMAFNSLSHLPESLCLSPPFSSFFVGFHYYGGGAKKSSPKAQKAKSSSPPEVAPTSSTSSTSSLGARRGCSVRVKKGRQPDTF